MNAELAVSIENALGSPVIGSHPVGGGCIHDARRVDLADGRSAFVKFSGRGMAALLEAEERSLRLLAPHLRVPEVLASGPGWLALEWLDLRPSRGAAVLGKSLARLHSVRAERHGLDHDNFIGETPQPNGPLPEWREFFIERRLRFQLGQARSKGFSFPDEEVVAAADRLLENHAPRPSLLHGDLWTGNVAALADGTPVVFDPAAHFGDPEADLAMLELFGAPLGREFFDGYGPEPAGRRERLPLYDLYHALNHVNLFGGGYIGMVRGCLDRLGI